MAGETPAEAETADEIPARRVVDRLFEVSPVVRHWGVEVLEAKRGFVRLAMAVRPDMANTHGVCHGGVIFTLADSCFGFAANSYNDRYIAASCEIKFLMPAEVGDILTAASDEIWKRGRSSLYDITITNQAGDTVAIMRCHARAIGGRHIE